MSWRLCKTCNVFYKFPITISVNCVLKKAIFCIKLFNNNTWNEELKKHNLRLTTTRHDHIVTRQFFYWIFCKLATFINGSRKQHIQLYTRDVFSRLTWDWSFVTFLILFRRHNDFINKFFHQQMSNYDRNTRNLGNVLIELYHFMLPKAMLNR